MSEHTDLRLKSKLYFYAANVTSVYDGDTITVDVDLGLGMWRHGQTIRFWKVNTPELRGPEREQGLIARDFVRGLVLDKTILLRTILDKRGEDSTGKFGRLLGEILVADAAGEIVNVNEQLLEKGFAVPMTAGGSRVPAGAVAPPEMAEGAPVRVILCPYCGEERAYDLATRTVEMCPNCLDAAYVLA